MSAARHVKFPGGSTASFGLCPAPACDLSASLIRKRSGGLTLMFRLRFDLYCIVFGWRGHSEDWLV
jgi:hypothetical protein